MATVLLVVAAATSHSPVNHWWSCATPTRESCVAHAMPLHHRKPVGYWQKCRARCTVYPYWKVRRAHHAVRSAYRQVTRAVRRGVMLPITGYSFGCGAYGNPMASGIQPYVGAVSSDIYPFGTRIYVPSLGYSGIVEDRGVGTGGLDLFEASCAATYKDTGYREVIVG